MKINEAYDSIPLYNSRITNTYIEYLTKYYPEIDIDPILDFSGIERYELEDPAHWFNQKQVDRFHEIVLKKTGNINISREAGRYITSTEALGYAKQYVLGLVNMTANYMLIAKGYPILSRAADVKAKKIGPNKIEIAAIPKANVNEKPYQCENRKGIFESMPKYFTGTYAKIVETSCFHKGDDCCRYIVTWAKSRHSIWAQIRRIAFLTALLSSVIIFMALPLKSSIITALILFIIFLLISNITERLIKNKYKETIEIQGNAAKNLIDEMNIRHSNAILIQEIGKVTSTNISIDRLISKVLINIQQHLDFDRGCVLFPDNDKSNFRLIASFGYSTPHISKLKQYVCSSDESTEIDMFESVLNKHKIFISNDVRDTSNNLSKSSKNFFESMEIESYICVPIIYEKELLGILFVDNVNPKRHLSQSDISLLTGVAAQTAVSIVNARSYAKLEENKEQIKMSHDELEQRVQERTAELVATEKHLRALLKEKDMLLKEVHHRVKNNLQVVSSLLDMTRRRAVSKETSDLLTEAHTKIYTMALIHSQLYKSNRVNEINIGIHLQGLIQHLSQLYGQGKYIQPLLVCNGIYLPVTQAIPIAFVMNELISNAYKYAFEEGKEGKIEVTIIQAEDNGKIFIKVKDNGVGIPEEIDIEKTDSLGMKLIRNLATKQLRGTLEIIRDQGTEINIVFTPRKEET
jgi:two-component sensor histidine kinase